MTDFDPCIRDGEHQSSQRHARAVCPSDNVASYVERARTAVFQEVSGFLKIAQGNLAAPDSLIRSATPGMPERGQALAYWKERERLANIAMDAVRAALIDPEEELMTDRTYKVAYEIRTGIDNHREVVHRGETTVVAPDEKHAARKAELWAFEYDSHYDTRIDPRFLAVSCDVLPGTYLVSERQVIRYYWRVEANSEQEAIDSADNGVPEHASETLPELRDNSQERGTCMSTTVKDSTGIDDPSTYAARAVERIQAVIELYDSLSGGTPRADPEEPLRLQLLGDLIGDLMHYADTITVDEDGDPLGGTDAWFSALCEGERNHSEEVAEA